MENKGDLNTEKQDQKFMEKYGIWVLVTGLISGIFLLKIILDLFQK